MFARLTSAGVAPSVNRCGAAPLPRPPARNRSSGLWIPSFKGRGQVPRPCVFTTTVRTAKVGNLKIETLPVPRRPYETDMTGNPVVTSSKSLIQMDLRATQTKAGPTNPHLPLSHSGEPSPYPTRLPALSEDPILVGSPRFSRHFFAADIATATRRVLGGLG